MSNEINGGVLPEVTVTAENLYKPPGISVPSMTMPDKLPTIKTTESKYVNSTGEGMIINNGFYYDQQMSNNLLTVSLHSNTETTDGGITWGPVSGDKDETPGEWKYAIEPLFRAFLTEDYQTAISNSWSEFGDDAIGNLFNQFKPYAPYLGHLSEVLKEMNSQEKEIEEDSNNPDKNTKFFKIVNGITDILQGVVADGGNILNRSLIAQGARFSYYGGTGVGFGNLTMKFTVFANWIDGEFKTVDSQLQSLYPYCFGKYTQFMDSSGQVTGTSSKELKFASKEEGENGLDISDDMKIKVNEYFRWQLPPAGFEAQVKDIDTVQKGTLKLKFGAFYAIDNLVVSDAQFNFSKQMVKIWKDGENDLSPLYCDVTLTFKPASKFTDNKLLQFINGSGMVREKTAIENTLSAKLSQAKTNNENYLQGKGDVH